MSNGHTLNPVLRARIEKLRNQDLACEKCGMKVNAIGMPLHMQRAHGTRTAGDEALIRIQEHPGLTRREYAEMMGWDYSKTQTVIWRLIKNEEAHIEKDHSAQRVFPGPALIKAVDEVPEKARAITKPRKSSTPKTTIRASRSESKKASAPEKSQPKSGTPVNVIQAIEAADGMRYAWLDGKLYRVELILVD